MRSSPTGSAIPITEITLWLFGGVARMSKDTESAGAEFKIAAAGPAVTAVIALACCGVGIAIAGGEEFFKAMRVIDTADTSGVLALVAWLASINLLVLIFNLIPAFPLDGGRIARAIAWRLTGDRNRATRFAVAPRPRLLVSCSSPSASCWRSASIRSPGSGSR